MNVLLYSNDHVFDINTVISYQTSEIPLWRQYLCIWLRNTTVSIYIFRILQILRGSWEITYCKYVIQSSVDNDCQRMRWQLSWAGEGEMTYTKRLTIWRLFSNWFSKISNAILFIFSAEWDERIPCLANNKIRVVSCFSILFLRVPNLTQTPCVSLLAPWYSSLWRCSRCIQ